MQAVAFLLTLTGDLPSTICQICPLCHILSGTPFIVSTVLYNLLGLGLCGLGDYDILYSYSLHGLTVTPSLRLLLVHVSCMITILLIYTGMYSIFCVDIHFFIFFSTREITFVTLSCISTTNVIRVNRERANHQPAL